MKKFKEIKYNIKWWFQRANKGYCDSDLFSMDYWFLNTVPKMLKELKEMKHRISSSINS